MESVNPPKDRPVFLTVICILSYVGLGMSILNGLTGVIFGRITSFMSPFVKNIMEQDMDLDELPEGIRRMVESSFSVLPAELTFSCFQRFPYFTDPIACTIFLDLLNSARVKYGFKLWSYVIMPDHVHLLIWPKEKGHLVSQFLHSIKEGFGSIKKLVSLNMEI